MKKLLIIAIFAATAFSLIAPAKAAIRYGDLVKGSGPTVYYVTIDMHRLAFADEQTFRTWYPDFGNVQTISDADLAKMPFDGIASVRPGIRPIKGATDARVYGVDRNGALLWLSNESVAKMIYGDDWASKLAVVPDATLATYGRGTSVTAAGQYWWKVERDASPNLQEVNFRRIALRPPTPTGVTLAGAAVAPTTAPTRIIILPTVINDNGGGGKEGDVDFLINGARVMPQDGINVLPGTYKIYHGEFPGYAISAWSGDCAADGTVTVPANETRACFITFDDIPDAVYGSKANRPPMLTIHALVRNSHGGTLREQDVKLFIGSMQVANNLASTIAAADYTLYRVVPPGYTASEWSGDCAALGTIALRNGDEKTCYITLRD